jgi:hypothetical protein
MHCAESPSEHTGRRVSAPQDAIPADCFKSELSTSLLYVARDAVFIGGLFWLMTQARQTELYQVMRPARYRCAPSAHIGECVQGSAAVRVAVCSLYWFLQGTMFWAVFVLGHDCGHGSFSNSPLLNSILGNILHSVRSCFYRFASHSQHVIPVHSGAVRVVAPVAPPPPQGAVLACASAGMAGC